MCMPRVQSSVVDRSAGAAVMIGRDRFLKVLDRLGHEMSRESFFFNAHYMNDMDAYCTEILPLSLEIAQLIEEDKIELVKERITNHPQILTCQTFSIERGILRFAISRDRFDICKCLVAAGVDVNMATERGDVALGIAATDGRMDVVTWLLDCGAKVDGDPAGITTPLMDAITFGHVAIATLLIERGADVNRLNSRLHTTPLDLAMTWGQPEIERILRSKSAPSTLEPVDWDREYGGAILRFIDDQFGKVLPIQQFQVIGDASVGQRFAMVNKNKNKLLFTIGLFNIHQPMLELFIVLPVGWNVHIKTRQNQFPAMLLRAISTEIAKGMRIKEGDLITPDDAAYASLHWPASLAGCCVCDHYWGAEGNGDPAIPEEDNVDLWTLMPIKRGKGGMPRQSLEKNRTAGWAKLTLHLDPPH